jgi:putative transposase
MPRLPRELEPGLYHLTACGVRSEPVFLTGEDGTSYLELIGDVSDAEHFLCRGYTLMPNHIHLLIETPSGRVSTAMRCLQGIYAIRFNKRHDLAGHVFRSRFHHEHVDTEAYLLEVIRYIALNPVRAGLSETAAAWRWGSIACILGRRRPPDFLDVQWTLRLFGDDPEEARRRLAEFVAVLPEFVR